MNHRYSLSIFFQDGNTSNMEIPIKNKSDVKEWIDDSVIKAELLDKTNNKIIKIK